MRSFFNKSGEKKQPSRQEIDNFFTAVGTQNEKVVTEFCKKYPDHIDAANEHGETALGIAARHAYIAIEDILLDAKADPNKPGLGGESPFLTCVQDVRSPDDYPRLDKMLKSGADINFQSKGYANALSSLRKNEASLMTALMFAAQAHDEKLCDYLLKNGANPLLKDRRGKTARDQLEDLTGEPLGNQENYNLTAKLEKAEKEWVQKQSSVNEWQGKVAPNNWQGH